MQFLLLVHAATEAWESLNEQSAKAGIEVRAEAIAALDHGGHLMACSPLTDPREAVEVRVRGGETRTRPPATVPEPVAGFYLIEARDLPAAVELAASIPDSHDAHLTVRPLLALDGIPDHVRRPDTPAAPGSRA